MSATPLSRPKRNYTPYVLTLALGIGLGITSSKSRYFTSAANPLRIPKVTNANLEQQRETLEIVKKLRKDPYWRQVTVNPYSEVKMPGLANHLTQGTLRGEGMLSLTPLLFVNEADNHTKCIVHVGDKLCGHKGIIHGGILATLLDEIIGRATIPHLPHRVGFTVNLNINYRNYLQSNKFVLLESKLEEVKGRKAIGQGWIKDIDEVKIHADAKGIFVSPKYGILTKIAAWF